MRVLLVASVLLEATSAAVIARAPRDFGTFTLDCASAEGACNNACFHISCVDPASATKVYAGPKEDKVANTNRENSGNTIPGPAGGSVCRTFPFSQRVIPALNYPVDTYTSDEWPMASSIQAPYSSTRTPNSLRCIPGTENSSTYTLHLHVPSRSRREQSCFKT